MWKNLLSSVAGIGSAIYIYLIVAAVSGVVVGYSAYSWTSDYYEAKIEKSNIEAEQKVNDEQRKGDQIVAQYIKQIEALNGVNTSLQRQISAAVRPDNGASCTITNGFVRLHGASAIGSESAPSSTDGTPSPIDLATLLAVDAENHAKYLKVAKQLEDLQAFEKAKQ